MQNTSARVRCATGFGDHDVAHLVLPFSRMWFARKPNVESEERLQIRAQLKKGETLHITFSDESADDLDIEGPGDIRLAIRPRREFRAEVVRGSCTRTSATSG